jgi:hypothetical protein
MLAAPSCHQSCYIPCKSVKASLAGGHHRQTREFAAMAEFRKFSVQFDTERTRVADPPGFDAAAAREQVSGSATGRQRPAPRPR